MTTKQAIERLDEMQRQIIHGKRIFGDIADILRDAKKVLDSAGVAVGNEHTEYSLAERIKWMADVRDCFRRQVDELRALTAKSSNVKGQRAGGRETSTEEPT